MTSFVAEANRRFDRLETGMKSVQDVIDSGEVAWFQLDSQILEAE